MAVSIVARIVTVMATDLLTRRLQKISAVRAAAGDDPTPTLLDIERTHILFMNAHFKPFAAIGFEYNKVQVNSGQAQFGATLQFSIPQFGDFFYDMCLHMIIGPVTGTDASQAVAGTPDQDSAVLRYVAFPGERILRRTRFSVNGNPLDEYTAESTVLNRLFKLSECKKHAYYRAVGQQVPETGSLLQWDAQDNQANAVIPSIWPTPEEENLAEVKVNYGPQTPRPLRAPRTNLLVSNIADANGWWQPRLEMFIPLHFWFNDDPRLMIPSVSIPYGQRFIEFDLEQAANMYDFATRATGLITEVAITVPTIEVCELYINNVFVNPEVHDIYIKRIGFSLVRVHRIQEHAVRETQEEILLNNMKWPIEAMFLGIRPDQNIATRTTITAPAVNTYTAGTGVEFAEFLDGWCTFYLHERRQSRYSHVAGLYNAPVANNLAANWSAQMWIEHQRPAITRMTLRLHGIPIYNDFPWQFYNQYLPFKYGSGNICSSDDLGALAVFFCLYPGTYQPSSHINISRAREFYLIYTSRVIGITEAADYGAAYEALAVIQARLNIPAGTVAAGGTLPYQRNVAMGLTPSTVARTGRLFVTADALNFLLISDGSAVLRYST